MVRIGYGRSFATGLSRHGLGGKSCYSFVTGCLKRRPLRTVSPIRLTRNRKNGNGMTGKSHTRRMLRNGGFGRPDGCYFM